MNSRQGLTVRMQAPKRAAHLRQLTRSGTLHAHINNRFYSITPRIQSLAAASLRPSSMVRVLIAPWRLVGERKMGESCGDREVWRFGLACLSEGWDFTRKEIGLCCAVGPEWMMDCNLHLASLHTPGQNSACLVARRGAWGRHSCSPVCCHHLWMLPFA